jgi:hypothetical protein
VAMLFVAVTVGFKLPGDSDGTIVGGD